MSVPPLGWSDPVREAERLDPYGTAGESERLDPAGTEQYRHQAPRRDVRMAPAIDRM